MPTKPGLSGLTDVVFGEEAVNTSPQIIDAGVTFTVGNAVLNGKTLTVSGLLPEDILSIADSAVIRRIGDQIYFGLIGSQVLIGAVTGGVGDTLEIKLNANATEAMVDALLERLSYLNLSDSPTLERTLTIDLVDSGGASQLGPVWGAPVQTFAGIGGIPPGRIALGDPDQDGDLDLMIGRADGQLTLVTLGPDGAPTSVVIVAGLDVGSSAGPAFLDYDGDGDIDMLVGSADGNLHLIYGSPGGFVEMPFGGNDFGDSTVVATGDLDGDGDLDLVIGNAAGELTVIRKDPLTLSPWFTATVGAFAAPAIGDVDGDGDADLLIGLGDGTFTALIFTAGAITETVTNFKGWDLGTNAQAAFGDLDGDGDLDLMLVGTIGAQSQFYSVLNEADNTVKVTVNAAPEALLPAAGPPALVGLAPSVTFDENVVNAAAQRLDADVIFRNPGGAVDLDGAVITVSGLLAEDIVSIAQTGHVVVSGNQIFFDDDGDGQGSMSLIGTWTGGVGGTLTISFDGVTQVAWVERVIEALAYRNTSDDPTASRDLTINVTDASGLSVNQPRFLVENSAFQVSAVGQPGLYDFNGDGRLDIVFGHTDGTIWILANLGSGMFGVVGPGSSPFGAIDVGSNAEPTMADVDGDGDQDLVVGRADGTLAYFRNMNGSFVAVADGGQFGGIDIGVDSRPIFLDTDRDGDLDLIVAARTGDQETLNFYLNNGSGFDWRADAGLWVWAGAGDMNGDGFADLIADDGVGGLQAVDVFVNDSTFSLSGFPAAGLEAFVGGVRPKAAFGDIDGDGDLDMVIAITTGLGVVYNTGQIGRTITVNVNAQADEILGTAGHDTLWGTPDEDVIRGLGGNDIIHALASDDLVYGDAGADTLYGDEGSDELFGGAANDTLIGGAGCDDMIGGAGNDIYYVDDACDTVTELLNEGTDTVIASVDHSLTANLEKLTLTGPAARIDGYGNALANTITGNDSVNRLDGGAGADILLGGGGNDILLGRAGRDSLTGGTGGDVFAFTNDDTVRSKLGQAAEIDKILDFRKADGDSVDLSGIDANANLAGDQAFTWAAGGVFHKVAGEATAKVLAGVLIVELDVDGDGKSDFRIEITGQHGVSDSGRGGVPMIPEGWVL